MTRLAQRLELRWIGSSRKDLVDLPEPVKRQFGYVLGAVQRGDTASRLVKHWSGAFPRTFEICLDHRGDTFRVIYTTRVDGKLYVLHAFQKKSHSGRETPQHVIDCVSRRQIAVNIDSDR